MNEKFTISENGSHRDPFVVPEGYFDSLEERVMQRIDTMPSPKRTSRTLTFKQLMQWSAAACVLVAAGLMYWQYSIQTSQIDENTLISEISTDEEWEDAMEYALIDNEEIAYYLTEAN
ncbi:MAG: hypothetical protein HUK01_09830 [Bacteroidaceae bacterium]|nr:hypothetical protein [Bacteroidaceae bacterium]